MTRSGVRLLLADVDGTLITSAKLLTAATIHAVHQLHDAGVLVALTSGRPPRGLTQFVEPLALTTPLAGFNGGVVVDAELLVLRTHTIHASRVQSLLAILRDCGLQIWLYQGLDWFVTDATAPHVVREAHACGFSPTVRTSLEGLTANVVKIVGVSDDPDVIEAARRAVTAEHRDVVSATSSQTYYLDITDRHANKGTVVDFLATHFSLERHEIATIGDMANDLLMFAKSGVSIAMGNGSRQVQTAADHVTLTNDDDGFAHAVTTLILPSRSQE